MEEIWNRLTKVHLSPNQLYVLWSIREKMGSPLANTALELRLLEREGWLIRDKDGMLKPSAVALKFLRTIDGFFTTAKKKTDKELMGDDFEKKAQFYNEIFPRVRTGAGKPARSNIKSVLPTLRWFFENYDYGWDLIFEATQKYVDKQNSENWKYGRTSQYFVRKQDIMTKIWTSDLADHCELALGGEDNLNAHFKDDVFN